MTVKDELKRAGALVLPPVAPEQPESTLLIDRLRILGFVFRLNLCADTIEVNGQPLDDLIAAEIRVALRDVGLPKKLKAAEDAYFAAAKKDAYHPIRDYLDGLQWDEGDHIAALTSHLYSCDPPIVYQSGAICPLHEVYFHRWFVGAVAKVYTGAQNPMLVLDGPQGIGKSTLAHWLCPIPGFFLEGPINVSDKDSDIRLISHWIWEVSELDATTRKADQSAIKSFITKETVTVRKSYGRHDIKKPAMASLIGTLNNTSGFLADESGSRRFMITKLDRIDLKYQLIDIGQLWAQAVHLYRTKEKWQLRGEEVEAQRQQNDSYEVASILDDYLDKYFIFDPSYDDPMSLADIISEFSRNEIRLSGSERAQAMELARILVRRGAKKVRTHGGNRWIGLIVKT